VPQHLSGRAWTHPCLKEIVIWTSRCKNSWIQSLAARFCCHARVLRLGLLRGCWWGRALHSLSGAPASGMLTPLVYSKNTGSVLTVTTYWYEYSFGAEGQGTLPKWGDRELFIEVACNLQANIKENCILFMWWASLLLHIATWGSPWESWLVRRLKIAFWVMGEGHPP